MTKQKYNQYAFQEIEIDLEVLKPANDNYVQQPVLPLDFANDNIRNNNDKNKS